MKRLARATVAAVTVLGLGVPGIVGASSSITTSGADAYTKVKTSNKNEVKSKTKNNLNVSSNASQNGKSGKVETEKNTDAGDSASGDVTNEHNLDGTIAIDNSGATAPASLSSDDDGDHSDAFGDIVTSGADATTKVETKNSNKVVVKTTNNLNISSNVSQNGSTGNVEVEKNTAAGDATSGSVSNTSSTSFDVSVTN